MNNVSLVGRLTKDVELRKSANNKDYAFITLAINRPYKNAEGEIEADFIDCQVWEETAKNLSSYCHKGDLIAVNGVLSNYKDKENHTQTIVTANNVSFLSTKKEKEA